MNIGIDIDDTISNTHDILFSYAEKYTIDELNKKIKGPENKMISANGDCQRFHGWTDKETANFWDEWFETVIKEVTPKKFAKEVIEKLRNEGHKIYIITARYHMDTCNVEQITKNWLKDNEIEYDEIIFNAEDKVNALKNNNIDLFIDDKAENCKLSSEAGIKTYIMNSVENQEYIIPDVKRVYTWVHVEQEIEKDLGGKM